MICILCERDVERFSKHHLTPASRGGKETVPICEDCHSSIHRFFTNIELERVYNTVEKLLEHEDFKKHIKWLSKQPIETKFKTLPTKKMKGRKYG